MLVARILDMDLDYLINGKGQPPTSATVSDILRDTSAKDKAIEIITSTTEARLAALPVALQTLCNTHEARATQIAEPLRLLSNADEETFALMLALMRCAFARPPTPPVTVAEIAQLLNDYFAAPPVVRQNCRTSLRD